MTTDPKPAARRKPGVPLSLVLSGATVGFAFVFAAVSVALLAGGLPKVLRGPQGEIDTGVLLLFLPLCALALGMVAEVVRAAFSQPVLSSRKAVTRQPLSEWKPGLGEG